MSVIQRTAQAAEEDLIGIWLYIAQDNPGAADRLLDDIEEGFHALADNPLMGRLRPDIAQELRYFTVGKYLMPYRTVFRLFVLSMALVICLIYSDCLPIHRLATSRAQ